ncbi:hypothetical protein HX038_15410 [Myroides odoratimimus]|uniref:hypothetical protein n=1 Tax=Myroides odoratimimus TaxID=76832 RepID=UPI002576F2C8|nr:hypothetical protein [Myroides odoratimimus]MDM1412123.1 hypothetical protein [Myroides odoratimimus]
MKKYIQNLLVPFAVLAMLTVGAFTINASEKTDKAVNVETVTEPEAEPSYQGKVYIRTEDPITHDYIFNEVYPTSEGDCSLTILSERCTVMVDGIEHDLWGEDSLGDFIPLYKL